MFFLLLKNILRVILLSIHDLYVYFSVIYDFVDQSIAIWSLKFQKWQTEVINRKIEMFTFASFAVELV